jgi:TRAP-type C4-dicarboxylate transport system permease small subunit
MDVNASHPEPDGSLGRILERACEALALAGGMLLVGIMLVSTFSVVGRSLPELFGATGLYVPRLGISGDIELEQMSLGVAVFAFLPLCQLQRANVLVSFFTKNLPVRHRAKFDAAANVLFFGLALTIASQLTRGTLDKLANADTSMVLRIPEWIAYAIALPSIWLLVLVAAYTVARSWSEIRRDRAIGPQAAGEH